MEIKENWLKYLIYLVVLLTLYFKASLYLDPDFGYRLQNGRVIINEGIEAIYNDRWSYTMAGYPFIEHSWGSAVVWAKLYQAVGYMGIAFVYSFLAFAVLIVIGKAVEVNWPTFKTINLGVFKNPLVILTYAVLLPFFGIRAQVITWLFFALLIYITFNRSLWEKTKYFVPVLLLVWANLHAGFALGLIYLITLFIFQTINLEFKDLSKVATRSEFFSLLKKTFLKPKFNRVDFLVILLSILLTLINPYDIGLWEKVLFVVSDSSLRWRINEWKPFFLRADLASAFIVTLSFVFVTKHVKKIKLRYVFFYLFLLYQGVSSIRHLPILSIFSVPLTTMGINYFYKDVKKVKFGKNRFAIFYKIILLISLVLLLVQIFAALDGARELSQESFYPKKAVAYLKEKQPEGRIFSVYRWGGYLIWKYPEKKVFVSGQMPSWRWENHPEDKLESSFDVYNKILEGETNHKPTFEKYNIDIVLYPAEAGEDSALTNKILPIYKKIFGKNPAERKSLIVKLKEEGWRMVYEDDVSKVYEK